MDSGTTICQKEKLFKIPFTKCKSVTTVCKVYKQFVWNNNLIKSHTEGKFSKKDLSRRFMPPMFSREFKNWHLQWENGFYQITRQRLVGS